MNIEYFVSQTQINKCAYIFKLYIFYSNQNSAKFPYTECSIFPLSPVDNAETGHSPDCGILQSRSPHTHRGRGGRLLLLPQEASQTWRRRRGGRGHAVSQDRGRSREEIQTEWISQSQNAADIDKNIGVSRFLFLRYYEINFPPKKWGDKNIVKKWWSSLKTLGERNDII